jgi:hypothetical protein
MNGNIPAYDRIAAFDQDILDSRSTPSLSGEAREIPEALASDLVAEADAFLNRHEIESRGKLNELLEELDTALAINNNPRARELRRVIEERYNEEAML